MPLQNRVDPFGDIHAVAERGLFTGNRGSIHDPSTQTLLRRRWTTRAWIVCDCAFRGRRRDVMGRNAPTGGAGWTELFFLDEVTALTAGHRPCFYCRRERALDFARAFAAGQGRAAIAAPAMDSILHAQRRASAGGVQPPAGQRIDSLPDGAMVAAGELSFARRRGGWLRWSFAGWSPAGTPGADAVLLTPTATVAALDAGYRPAWHSSADG